MGIDALVRAAAQKLSAEVEAGEGGAFHLTVSATTEAGQEAYQEVVSVFEHTEGGAIYVRNTFGHNDGSTDLGELLRLGGQMAFGRVYLEAEDGAEEEYFVIDSALPLAGLTPDALAVSIQEVVDYSGSVRALVPSGEDEA